MGLFTTRNHHENHRITATQNHPPGAHQAHRGIRRHRDLRSNGDPEDPIFQDAVDAQNPAALQMAHERLKGFLLGGDLGDEGDAVGDALELAVQLQSMYRGA